MKYLLISFALLLPLSASAQLSSENFQIDSFSIGTNQSIGATSSNFEVTQETGGLFELDAEADEDISTVGRLRERESASSTEDIDAETSPQPDIEVSAGGVPGAGDSSTDNNEVGSQTGDGFTPTLFPPFIPEITRTVHSDGTMTCSPFLWCYFWYWWPLTIILALYISWRLWRRY